MTLFQTQLTVLPSIALYHFLLEVLIWLWPLAASILGKRPPLSSVMVCGPYCCTLRLHVSSREGLSEGLAGILILVECVPGCSGVYGQDRSGLGCWTFLANGSPFLCVTPVCALVREEEGERGRGRGKGREGKGERETRRGREREKREQII